MKKCPDAWLPRTVLYCHAVQSMKSDENKSVLLPNLYILIKHFLLNIYLLPQSQSVDVLRILHQEKSRLHCQMTGQGHFCSDCSCSSQTPSSAWQMVQSWGDKGDFLVWKTLFPSSSVSWGQKAKTMVRFSGHFNWTSSVSERSCISKR